MREIKFRVWNKEEGMHYLDTFFVGASRMPPVGGWSNRIPMQFTGLKDKNGKEIYEGDIIEWEKKEWYEENKRLETPKVVKEHKTIEWETEIENCSCCSKIYAFGYNISDDYSPLTADKIEVIGNIYENPELIK